MSILKYEIEKKFDSLTPPSSNISKYSGIDSISANLVKSDVEICRLRKKMLI